MEQQTFEFRGPGQFYSIQLRAENIGWLIRSLGPLGYNLKPVNTEKPSEFHLTGPDIELVIGHHEKPATYSVDAYVAEPDPDNSGQVKAYRKKVKVPTNEDYVQGTISLSKKRANDREFSKLEAAIRNNCNLVRDMGAEYKQGVLQSSSEENPIPIGQLARL